MKKILFLIHDLGRGGAEKVLVNLVNNMDTEKFDITVMALFGGGVNEQFLKGHIKYRAVFPRNIPGNSHWMKLFTPRQLHDLFIRELYDIEIAYLEGPSARVISGCHDMETKLACWIHSTQSTPRTVSRSFRSIREAEKCYGAFDQLVGVSDTVRKAFLGAISYTGNSTVLYNINESETIVEKARCDVEPELFHTGEIKLAGVGKLQKNKGFDRLLNAVRKLREAGYPVHLYLLGEGQEEERLRATAEKDGIKESVTFLGYQTNPYKYVARCDLFVCSSYSEGFSTAATEALIVGTPVITTEVSGMREMLGDNEYGVITENNEEALYQGIKRLLDDPALLGHYKEKTIERGKAFCTENTVKAVEDMLLSL